MSGIQILRDPSGVYLGLDLKWLENTPISDYTLVGIWFLTGFGLLPLVAAWGLWTRKHLTRIDTIKQWTHQHWSWTANLLFAILGVVWIIIQIIMIGYLIWIQGLFLIIPLILLVLVFLPSVRTYLEE